MAAAIDIAELRRQIAELKRPLERRIETVVQHLLPAGRRDGHEWRVGSLQGEEGQSLAVHMTGEKTGVWGDFSTGQSGDIVDLWREVRGLDLLDALDDIRAWLGVADDRCDRHEISRRRDNQPRPSPQATDNSWRPIWSETVENGPHKAYLLGRLGRLPQGLSALRYHSRCPRGRDRLPAMVALMCDAVTNEPTGIHRTFIKPDGSGKADVQPAKMMMGRAAGSVVRLTPDENVTTGLGICEGIEDGIAILNAGWAPVWCCMSAGNIAALPLLHGIESLTVFADADSPGRKAAATVAQRWRQAGGEAVIAEPPVGIKDFGEMGNA